MKKMMKYIFITILCMVLIVLPSSAWYDTDFDYRKSFTINNTGSNLTDYQVAFTVNRSAGSDANFTVYLNNKCESDYDDIRFVGDDDATEWDYWIESSSSTVATIWVEVPSIPNSTAYGSTTGYIYYNNSGASAVSNGTNTFPFFDDFLGSSLDTGIWDSSGSPTIVVSGGTVTITATAAAQQGIYSKTTFGGNYIARGRWKEATMTSISYPSFGFSNTGATRQLIIFAYADGSNKFSSKTNNGATTLTQIKAPLDTDWHILEVIRISTTSVKFYFDSNTHTISTTIPSDSLPVGVYAYGTPNSAVCDWVLVRKYASAEPTYSLGSSESLGCIASFTSNTTSGQAPLSVDFTDNSTGSITNWYWDVTGDNIADYTTENCTHTYSAVGSYTVNLTVSDGSSTNTTIETNYITVTAATGGSLPTAAFSANTTSGSTPLTVAFTDSSTNTPTAWWWDVDNDGNTDYFTQNCNHTYSVGGTYTVNLTVSNAYGADSELKINYITTTTGITANFTGTPTSGSVPLVVQFNDTSYGGTPSTWNWSFGDGALFNTTDPAQSNTTHDYLTPGIYSVNLTVNDTSSSDYEFKPSYINAENIRTNFTYNVSIGVPPFVVQFNATDEYGTITNWTWDVQGDGFPDYFTQNCTHTYDAIGTFSVNLTVNNTATSNFSYKDSIISSGSVPIVNFTASTTDGAAPLIVTFTDTSTGSPTTWAWDVSGDGVIDNITQNASYRYTTSGYYTIRHRANNTFGTSWENKTDFIFVGAPPVANFANHSTTIRNISPGSSIIFNYTGNGTETLSFEWDVNGDGSTDYTTRNISHTYNTQGTYNVNMRAYSSYGSDWENKTGYVLVGTAPTGVFTSNVTSGVVPFAVNFINQTTGYPTPSYAWDIDNSGSTDYTTASPNHTYTSARNYSVKLTTTNAFGSNVTTMTEYITAGTIPVSNFSVDARNGTLPFTVNFYANMTGWPNASYAWDLTGDGVTDATGRNTTYTYTTAGLYTINLTTTNMFGSNVTSRSNYIAAGMEPKIKFSAHPLTGTNILTTTFTDLTGGSPTIWNWSFGDGEYNETQNPTHYYGTVGDFNVSLNATNGYGYNSTTYYYYIVVSGEPISTVIFTYPATNVTSSSVSMCGGIAANYSDDVWFEYGLTPSALTFSTRETRNLSGESNFTSNMSGTTLYGGSTYYYRAASEDYGKGVVRSFTVPTPSPDIAEETVPQAFETELDRFERFDDADFDFMAMAPIVAEVYTSVWGFWIYGLIWAGVFGAFFLRHEDITIPTFLYILFSFTISSYLPASWMPFIYVSVAVCLAAIVYTLYRGVRNG